MQGFVPVMRAKLASSLLSVFTFAFLIVPYIVGFHSLPVQTFYPEWAAFAAGSMLFVVLLFAARRTDLAVPRVVILPLGFVVLILLHLCFGRIAYWQQAITAILYLMWAAALMWAGHALRLRVGYEQFGVLVARALTAGAVVCAIAGIAQRLGVEAGGLIMPMIGPRAHANLAQSNHFAAYVCFGLISLCLLRSTGQISNLVAGGLALVMLAAVEFSASRSVWIYLLGATMLACWAYYYPGFGGRVRQQNAVARTRLRLVLIWSVALPIALTVVAFMLNWLPLEYVSGEVRDVSPISGSQRLLNPAQTVSPRQGIWLAAWLMIQDAPVVGVGFGQFAHAYFSLSTRLPAGLPEVIVDNAHNVVLHAVAEFGIAGGFLLVFAAIAWLVPRIRRQISACDWWLLAVVGIHVTHSLAEYPLWYAHFLGVFALLVGAGAESVWKRRSGPRVRMASGVVALIMLWLLADTMMDYRMVERLGKQPVTAPAYRQMLVQAARDSSTSLFGPMLELGLARTIALNQTALAAKLELNTRVLSVYPAPDVAFRQSALHALDGDMNSARRMWDRASFAYPGEVPAAIRVLERSVSGDASALVPLVEYAASRAGPRE